VKVDGMSDLDQQRGAMARAEAGVVLSMRQPTVATRMDAIQRQFAVAEGEDHDALVAVIAARLAIKAR
jgi:hypothetical protein